MIEQQKRDERQRHVHPKFVSRWASRFLELQKSKGRGIAIQEFNRFLNPDDALAVGREARRLRELNSTLDTKEPA